MNRPIRHLMLSAMTALAIFSCTGCQRPSNPEAEAAAAEAAQQWLNLVDNHQYEETWGQGSDFFKAVVGKEDWINKMVAIRKPMGPTVSRSRKSTSYRTTMPGAADGEYVIAQFNTSFENKKKSVETVTMVLGEDGQWRLAGYYIR